MYECIFCLTAVIEISLSFVEHCECNCAYKKLYKYLKYLCKFKCPGKNCLLSFR